MYPTVVTTEWNRHYEWKLPASADPWSWDPGGDIPRSELSTSLEVESMVLQRRWTSKERCPQLRDSPKAMFGSRQKHLAVFLFRAGEVPKKRVYFLGLTTQRSSITEFNLIIPGSNGITPAETCRGQTWPSLPQPLQKPVLYQNTCKLEGCSNVLRKKSLHKEPEEQPSPKSSIAQPVKWLLFSKAGKLAPFLAFLYLPMHALAVTSHPFLCTIKMFDEPFPQSP